MSGRRRASQPRKRVKRETSAGGIVTRGERGRRVYLLIRDSHGNWGFPKGHLERGEKPEAAALREVAEETGAEQLALRAPLETINWMFTWKGALIKKTCHFFLMESDSARTVPQAEEGITECRWCTVDEALSLVRYENSKSVLRKADRMAASA